jgi:hypothetical protein
MKATIETTITPKIGFALHQNSVPVVRELALISKIDEPLDDLVLELTADPGFLEPKRWLIERLEGRAVLHIRDRDVKLQGGFLANLTERMLGEVRLRLTQGEEEITSVSVPTHILTKNTWAGCETMLELLPAFCMPNDPAVDHILKRTTEVLRQAGKLPEIDGYMSASRSRTWELISAMWSAVCGLNISYTLSPASLEEDGQKIRTPSAILESRVASCMDLTLLFASVMEQARLNPVLILLKEHAYVGVWLQPQEFAQILTDEAAALRKRVELQELLVFETTMVSKSPTPSFSQAVECGRQQLTDEDFLMAIDVRRARMQHIYSLALGDSQPASQVATDLEKPSDVVLEEAPPLPAFDVEWQPNTLEPADRLDIWQRKLLDLTTRNRLLHFPVRSKCIPLLCPAPAALEDLLSNGKKIRIVPIPELKTGGRDVELYTEQTNGKLEEEIAREFLQKGEVLSPLPKAKLQTELIDLYRKARTDIDEGGANTLFLAIGFLHWKKLAEDPRTYRAPLILMPVKLERKSVLSGVTLIAHEDEPRFNLTLLELLRQDFKLTIPGLDQSLPTDECGVDVPLTLEIIRQAVKELPGFEVVTDAVIGTFSFAKYLMWKDLVDRKEQLMRSPVVRHLIEKNGDSLVEQGTFPRPEELDRTVGPESLFIPLPADSSQIAAVVASAMGCNFVLDGPPGTGKSQTIANMIAHNLGLGRKVLFVAEKMAALDVVKRRLEQQGLGAFCLEVHSNKTSKMAVLKQLERAWETKESVTAKTWQDEAGKVGRTQDRLNAIVKLLHERHPNGWTLHEAIGRVVRDGNTPLPKLDWPAGTVHDEESMSKMREVVRRLELNLSAQSSAPQSFAFIANTEWSNSWQESLLSAASAVTEKSGVFNQAATAWIEAVGLPLQCPQERTSAEAMATFGTTLLQSHGLNMGFFFEANYRERAEAAETCCQLLVEYRQIESSGLSTQYPAGVCTKLDIHRLTLDWNNARQKFWPFSKVAMWGVRRALAKEAGVVGPVDPEKDLPQLARMRKIAVEIESHAALLQGIPGWAGFQTRLEVVSAAMQCASALRSSIAAHATSAKDLAVLRDAVRNVVVEGNELLAPNGPIAAAGARLTAALSDFTQAIDRFKQLSHLPPEYQVSFSAWREALVSIQQHGRQIKSWCDWCRTHKDAMQSGLAPIVEAIEQGQLLQGQIADAFEIGYGRWFAANRIDAEPLLRGFVSAEHLSDIATYRQLVDQLAALSSRYIRTKLCEKLPEKNAVRKKDGFGILLHELQKQRRHKPIRQLAVEMGDALTCLAPCMLMSPLSIAQYLPTDMPLFDLVIFDEASQITPWDAIGSIARGAQVIIAGDPRQMPPTSFFNRGTADSDDDVEEDMESILDECLGAGVPRHSLAWHYRSRNESLIAFSNANYYESKLVTFPAPVTKDCAVVWRRVDGIYDKGTSRTNPVEAAAMVAEAVRRMTDPGFSQAGLTLGIVTLNAEQQKLVEDLLDKARQEHPEIEPFFDETLPEPVVVKNLETVQGDERDLIMIGIGYGPTAPGAKTMSMNFGPLNREGGWRRLNVAVTRARREMLVFTSFDPSMIDLRRTSARAVADLKTFIEFAHRGPMVLADAGPGSLGGYASPFEEAVARTLADLGWQIIPQVGVSCFRIDLGIVHPDRPGDFLAGVECDGPTYCRFATARDRDKVRASVLGGLGWQVLRVWSTDWWVDAPGSSQRLHAELEKLLQQDREKSATVENQS